MGTGGRGSPIGRVGGDLAAAVLSWLAACAITFATWPLLRPAPLMPFLVAVMVSAWWGGLGPALLATALATVVGVVILGGPLGRTSGELAVLPVFVAASVAVAALTSVRRQAVQAERLGRLWFSDTLSSIGDAVIATDVEGRVAFINGAAESLTGWRVAEARGQPLEVVFRVLDGRTRTTPPDWLAKILRGEPPVADPDNLILIDRDGREVPIADSAAPIVGADGKAEGAVLVFRDVAAQKRAETALREARDRLEARNLERATALESEVAQRARAEAALHESNQVLDALVRASPLAIITLDPRGRVTTWNPASGRIFGWSGGEVLGRPQPNVPAELQEEHRSGLEASSRGEAFAGFETRRLRKDGSAVDVEIWTAPLLDDQGEFSGRLAIVADVTARKNAERERTDLLRRLVTSQEEERRRIARELHDQMGQHLAALVLGIQALREGPDDGPEARAVRFQRLQESTNLAGREAHRIALELRPPALDDLGLHSALLNHVEEWSERSRVEVDFQSTGLEQRRLDPELETALYRIVQEALTNVVRHAQARHVGLVLECRRDHLLAIVEDDGAGFDVEAVLGSSAPGPKLGLLGMRERVALVGGTMEVESVAGRGTTVLVRVPLAPEAKGTSWPSCGSS